MTQIVHSVLIKAPIEKVFQYASDYQKWPEFYEGVSEFNPTTETTRGNGAKYIYTAKILGMNVTVGTEITDFRENEGWIGRSFKGMEHKTEWQFKKSNEDTEFTHGITYKCPWYMGGKLVDKKFIEPSWKNIIKNSLKNLKGIIEEK